MSGPTFEEKLRTELQDAAGSVGLPSRSYERAVRRAWQRRRRRQVAIATATALVAAAVALNAALHPATPERDGSLDVGSNSRAPAAELEMVWRHGDGGIREPAAVVEDHDGTVYAVSTAPGVESPDDPYTPTPKALYRLGDDGTWEPLRLTGDRPRSQDLSTDGGLLYSITTAPRTPNPYGARISVSDDGGRTWTHDDIEPAEPPSHVVPWSSSYIVVQIASTADTTLALVQNNFLPDLEAIFPELRTDPNLRAEPYPDGYVLYRLAEDGTDPGSRSTTELFGPNPPPPQPGGLTFEEIFGLDSLPPTTVRTVTWEQLGIDGPDDLGVYYRVFRKSAGGWTEAPGADAALGSLLGIELDVAGGRFVAHTISPDRAQVLTSTDGSSWTPVTPPAFGDVLTMGPSLITVPYEGSTAYVSSDGGSTWADVDLPPDENYLSVTAGPLGFGYLVTESSDLGLSITHVALSTDLVHWTFTPIEEAVGIGAPDAVELWIGSDRVIVTARKLGPMGEKPTSVTAVGVPRRS